MSDPVRVLIVEDNGWTPSCVCASCTGAGWHARASACRTSRALGGAGANPDVILCDFSMPGFNATRALELQVPARRGPVHHRLRKRRRRRRGRRDASGRDRLPPQGPTRPSSQAVLRALDLRASTGKAPRRPDGLPPGPRIAATSQGVIIADAMAPDWPVVYANPTFAQLTGYAESETIGRNCRLQGEETDPRPSRRFARRCAPGAPPPWSCSTTAKTGARSGTASPFPRFGTARGWSHISWAHSRTSPRSSAS